MCCAHTSSHFCWCRWRSRQRYAAGSYVCPMTWRRPVSAWHVTLCVLLQLELLNMGKTGELKSIWQSASNTNVQFNLVRR
jgi:hypothetical protein